MVEAVDWPTFLREVDAQRYQMFFLGWTADYPDPHNFLDMLFHSQSSENHGHYVNSQVDQWLEQARTEQDRRVRFDFYRQAEQTIIDEAAWIPLWHDYDYYLIKPYVQGAEQPATLVPWLKDVALVQD